MEGLHSPFNQRDHKQNDPKAREAGIRFLRAQEGLQDIQENPDRYGPDLMFKDAKGTQWYLEVHINNSKNWNGLEGQYPYPTIGFWERKGKYLTEGHPYYGCNVAFACISPNLVGMYSIEGNKGFLQEYLGPSYNPRHPDGEENCYWVPWSLMEYRQIPPC